MKLIYRILILLGIFAGSLFYFGSNMKEKVFSIETKTMEMEDATLPYLSLLVEGQEVNLLHGYCSGLDVLTIRESITPLTSELSFSAVITENESNVKKVKYEVIALDDGRTLEEGAINALDDQDQYKIARIKLKESYTTGSEYVLRLTLITDKSKRVYFYTRIKILDKTNLSEKLSFVQQFHKATFDKESESVIGKYLEKPVRSNSSFSDIRINDSFDLVTYGTLNPSVVYEQIPTITEITKDTASISMEFVISVQTSSGTEYYRVKEHYRFMYTQNRCYLYDYSRSMESVFDPAMTSLSKSEFKVGVTSDPKIELVSSTDGTILSFVRDGILWEYHLPDNTLSQVFSFYQEKTDYVRDTFDNHDIRILNMDDTGNIDFIVYGYMNRGEYEGRVGIILYRYDKTLQRIAEQIYIPINTTYGILKEEIGNFCYRNQFDVFYLHIFDTIYSYNLTSKVFKVIAEGVTKDKLVYSREGAFIAYQDQSVQTSDAITVLHLEDGTTNTIQTADRQQLRLLGLIDQNIIYGIANPSDIVHEADGTQLYPMNEILIADSTGTIMKQYVPENCLVSNAYASDNVVSLDRIKRTDSSLQEFEKIDADYILNTQVHSTAKHQVTKRVTDMMMTEYYISLNEGVAMKEYPTTESTVNTVITEDTTVRINRPDLESDVYIAYAFGEIISMTKDAGTAITAADNAAGIVLNSSGRIVWERGVKDKKASIAGLTIQVKSDTMTSLQACIKMLLQLKNSDTDVTRFDVNSMDAATFLSNYLNKEPLKAEGITLDEALYFVYKNRPVIVFKQSGEAMLLTGYDSTSITVIDPAARSERKLALKDAIKEFEASGNVYITYVD